MKILAFICSLFVFLGMFIGKRKDLKYFSINSIFGLFMINGLVNILNSYNILYINYHSTTWLYVILSIIIGFIVMIIISHKCSNSDDLSIITFSLLNTYFLCNMKFNFLLILINIIYYIIIGIYIKDSKSYISIFIGTVVGIILSLISNWILGYIFCVSLGILFYFVYSIYNVVTKNKNKYAITGLLLGIVIAILGSIL